MGYAAVLYPVTLLRDGHEGRGGGAGDDRQPKARKPNCST